MEWCYRVTVGDVIYLGAEECSRIEDAVIGEYVVEEAHEHGGWLVRVRKLGASGSYAPSNLLVQFHQCHGYKNSILRIRLVRCMTRIFVNEV